MIRNMYIVKLLLLLLIIIISSCINKKGEDNKLKKTSVYQGQKKYDSKVIDLNKEALDTIKYATPPMTNDDSVILQDAIILLDKAISIDSSYHVAYANKAMILQHLNKKKEAIQLLDKITKIQPDYAEGFFSQGLIYEEIGNLDSAKIKYKESINAYNKKIEKKNNIRDKLNRAFIMSLLNKKKGRKEFEKLIKEYPKKEEDILFWKRQLLDNFNREKFIKNVPDSSRIK